MHVDSQVSIGYGSQRMTVLPKARLQAACRLPYIQVAASRGNLVYDSLGTMNKLVLVFNFEFIEPSFSGVSIAAPT